MLLTDCVGFSCSGVWGTSRFCTLFVQPSPPTKNNSGGGSLSRQEPRVCGPHGVGAWMLPRPPTREREREISQGLPGDRDPYPQQASKQAREISPAEGRKEREIEREKKRRDHPSAGATSSLLVQCGSFLLSSVPYACSCSCSCYHHSAASSSPSLLFLLLRAKNVHP